MILDIQLLQINGSVEFLLSFAIVFINECFSAKQGLFVTSSRFEGLSFRSCSACLFSDAGAALQAQRPIPIGERGEGVLRMLGAGITHTHWGDGTGNAGG